MWLGFLSGLQIFLQPLVEVTPNGMLLVRIPAFVASIHEEGWPAELMELPTILLLANLARTLPVVVVDHAGGSVYDDALSGHVM